MVGAILEPRQPGRFASDGAAERSRSIWQKSPPDPVDVGKIADMLAAAKKRGADPDAIMKSAMARYSAQFPRPNRRLLPAGGMEAAHAKRRVAIPDSIMRQAAKRVKNGESVRQVAIGLGYNYKTFVRKFRAWQELTQ